MNQWKRIKRWRFKVKDFILDVLSWIGFLWLFIEIFTYSTKGFTDKLFKNPYFFILAFVIIVIIAIIKNKPATSFKYRLRGKDSYIEIRIGDAFLNPGALVIPVNNCFDMSLGGNVLKANSIQRQLIENFYSSKVDHLELDISKFIDITTPHPIGKTIELEQKNKRFYLVANSVKQSNNRVKSELYDFVDALNGLWQYVALESARNTTLTIPLINTQHGRDSYLTREGVVKEIVNSYIENSKALNICENLIISIHPDDLSKGNIDLDELNDFLKFSCRHYRKVTMEKQAEDPDKASKIVGIEN